VADPKPEHGGEVKHSHQTYITPAFWINYAWTAVHALLGGFVIYQWFDVAHDNVVHGVGWHFVISTLLNSAWLGLWNRGFNILAFIAILFTSSSVSYVFYNLEKNHPSTSVWDKIFIHAPFSIWHGFIVLITTFNFFAVITTTQKDGPDTLHIVLAEIALVFLASTAIGYVEYKSKRGDVIGALVISYGLYAIYAQQKSTVIHWSALGFAVLTTLYPLRVIIPKLLGRTPDPAAAPLLG